MIPTRTQDAAFWRQHVDVYAQSGLSLTAYARQHSLAASTFIRWQRKLTAPAVVPLQLLAPAEPDAADGIVVLHGGCRVQLPTSVSPAWLAQLLRALP